MKSKKFRWQWLAVLLASAFLISACGKAERPEPIAGLSTAVANMVAVQSARSGSDQG
jgi:hypothetical protein